MSPNPPPPSPLFPSVLLYHSYSTAPLPSSVRCRSPFPSPTPTPLPPPSANPRRSPLTPPAVSAHRSSLTGRDAQTQPSPTSGGRAGVLLSRARNQLVCLPSLPASPECSPSTPYIPPSWPSMSANTAAALRNLTGFQDSHSNDNRDLVLKSSREKASTKITMFSVRAFNPQI